MNNIAVYTLTSPLHDAAAIDVSTKAFLAEVFPEGGYDLCGADYADFGSHILDLIYVRTGGTEGVFLKLLPELRRKGIRHYYLLTSGKSNSLAASMEILSYLNQNGLTGEVLHGTGVSERISALESAASARINLRGKRLGVLGKPSDWLIASGADPAAVREKLGIELVDIPMSEVKAAIDSAENHDSDDLVLELVRKREKAVRDYIPGAVKIHWGLHDLVWARKLDGFTIRCFDLLTAYGNTGCLALARLNSQGIPAACEGDVPALLSMMIANEIASTTGFMANPSRMDPAAGTIVFAHCTVPLDCVDEYKLDTHYESGIGVGIKGHFPHWPVTVFKVSGDLARVFIAEGKILRNLAEPDLCRTQIMVQLDDPSLIRSYFLTNPIGNHHIIIPGRFASALKAFFEG
ncbi:MAG: hypothetical protein J5740_00930 [Bacteroidales bacterium]|nr:hypothetical protein [Bacteroidales bacterium]